MPYKLMRMHRADANRTTARRPVMLAIAGDSAAGKTILTRGLVEALEPERSTSICTDDCERG
jgi:phosphoribulokinase